MDTFDILAVIFFWLFISWIEVSDREKTEEEIKKGMQSN